MKYFNNVQFVVQFINKTAYSHTVSDVTTSTSEITVDYCNQNYNQLEQLYTRLHVFYAFAENVHLRCVYIIFLNRK